MLIDLKTLINSYKLNLGGIIQVGAHFGQEYDYYKRIGIHNLIFIEPLHHAFNVLKQKIGEQPGVIFFNCACSDIEGNQKMYVDVSNNGMSSSLLKPKEHLVKHPDITFEKEEIVPVRKLDNLPFDRKWYNTLMMDVQGNELNVLKGATETLTTVDYIYTEINRIELYENCAMVDQLDSYLKDFKRVETQWVPNKGWGDAFYIRKEIW